MEKLKDNVLSKNARPAILIYLVVFTSLLIVADAAMTTFNVDAKYIDLLQAVLVTAVAAYFGARAYEKAVSMKG